MLMLLVLLPQFSFNFNETLKKACNPGKYRPLLFLVICHILSTGIWHLKRSYLSYFAIIHKAILVSFGKRLSRASRPLGLLSVSVMSSPTKLQGSLGWKMFDGILNLPGLKIMLCEQMFTIFLSVFLKTRWHHCYRYITSFCTGL